MQNVVQGTTADSQKHKTQNEKASSVHHDIGKTSSTPQSSISSPTKSNETFSELQPRFMTDSSESEEDSVSEVKGCFSFFNHKERPLLANGKGRQKEREREKIIVCIKREREREKVLTSPLALFEFLDSYSFSLSQSPSLCLPRAFMTNQRFLPKIRIFKKGFFS